MGADGDRVCFLPVWFGREAFALAWRVVLHCDRAARPMGADADRLVIALLLWSLWVRGLGREPGLDCGVAGFVAAARVVALG
jgi:hypothetical protein